MNIQNIMEIFDRFEKSAIAEMDLELEGAKLSLKKYGSPASAALPVSIPVTTQASSAPKQKGTEEQKTLKAPLAGTFYHAPSPEAEPFVKKGQKIHKGDVIGIIEAMKLMNEVTALEDGVVQEVVAEDGTLVAYDEVLITYV